MTNPVTETAAPTRRWRKPLIAAAVGLPLVAASLSLAQGGPGFVPTPVPPVAVSSLAPSYATAAKGEVAEIFGNKFVLQDASGRALVETGRAGEDGLPVAKGETVTVQGRFERGFLHAQTITRADGTAVTIGGPGGPRPGTLDWAKDRVGMGPSVDVASLTGAVERAGYTNVRVIGRGPKHVEVAASKDGVEYMLHIGQDGRVREHRRL